jgi:hypothetical protein
MVCYSICNYLAEIPCRVIAGTRCERDFDILADNHATGCSELHTMAFSPGIFGFSHLGKFEQFSSAGI